MELLKERKRKYLVCAALSMLIAIWFIWMMVFHGMYQKEVYEEKSEVLSDYNTLDCGNEIDQYFVADSYRMHGIQFVLVGLLEAPEGAFQLTISDWNDKVLYTENILYTAIENGDWTNIECKTRLHKGEEYQLQIVNQSQTETPYILTMKKEDSSAYNTRLYKDGILQQEEMVIGYGFYPEIDALEKAVWLGIAMLLLVRIWDLCVWNRFVEKRAFSWLPDWMTERKDQTFDSPVVGIILGCMVFLGLYGIRILNPCYDDWLLGGKDLSQHYLGWKFFRNASWSFPFGLMDNMTYPHMISIIYTDSIPLLAVICKMFRSLLPSTFQYFGWWGLLSMMLQGLMSWKILSLYLKNDIQKMIGTLFFLTSPILLRRMFFHTSLSSHWLILISIYLVLNYRNMLEQNKGTGIILMLGGMIPWIHIYFLPRCGIFVLIYAILHAKEHGKIRYFVIDIICFMIPALASIWMLGGFASGVSYEGVGLGRFGVNLTSLINPFGYSYFLSDKPVTDVNQWEGLTYLGIGMLLLFFLKLIQALYVKLILGDKSGAGLLQNIKSLMLPGCLILMVLSMSNQITFGDSVLCSIQLPDLIQKGWSVFRATGRLIWPVIYLLEIWILCSNSDIVKNRFLMGMLFLCLLIQVIDFHQVLQEKHQKFSQQQEYDNFMNHEEWQEAMAEKDGGHIYLIPYNFIYEQESLYAIADYASDHDMTLNNFYLARDIECKVNGTLEEKMKNPCPEDIFIAPADGIDLDIILYNKVLSWQQIGEYYVGTR